MKNPNEPDCWTYGQLIEQLAEYERHSEGRGLQPITVASYLRYARWFLTWCVGQWWPRSNSPRVSPRLLTDCADEAALRADLAAYAEYLSASHAPGAVHTYRHEAGMFIDWRYDRRRPGSFGGLSSGSGRLPPEPPAAPPAAPPPGDDDDWPSETSVQGSVVAWLVSQGWRITRVADTKAREHGVDVTASRGKERFLVEVKGHPSERYATGERAGQRRKWDPNAQARTYFGDALLAVLRMRDANPGTAIGLALPAMRTFTGLIDQVEASLTALGTFVILVAEDGSVTLRLPKAASER
jgi:hypothetical protein